MSPSNDRCATAPGEAAPESEDSEMGFVQAVLGGLFTILGAGSMFFIAYKALVIGNDVSEMKEILREMQRGSRGVTSGHAYPAPLDSYTPPAESKPDKEFVLPPPLSRRLDAERGIRRESFQEGSRTSDELEPGFKASERRR